MKTINQINELGNSLTKITSLALVIIYLISFNFVKSQNAYTAGKYELLLLDGEYYDITATDTFLVKPDYILIKLKDGISEIERNNFNLSYPIQSIFSTQYGITRYEISDTADFIELIINLAEDDRIQLYDINHLVPLTDIETERPNDGQSTLDNLLPQYPNLLWPYTRTHLFDAWELSSGNEDITVAVIDDGLWIYHPDIGLGNDSYSNVWTNPDEQPNEDDDDGN